MEILSLDNLVTLGMLVLLQAVLGFDNLLYISLESKRAPVHRQARVRRLGIGIAVFLRVALLLVLMKMVQYFQDPMFGINIPNVIASEFNFHSLIVLLGGIFIMYTATKEIMHMMSVPDLEHEARKPSSAANAIVAGGALMIWLSDRVATFLEKNRMYEVLGLFILLVVGIMLLTEGGHLAHLKLFGNEIVPMSKTTFYFVITVLVLTDLVQTRYKKRLELLRRGEAV